MVSDLLAMLLHLNELHHWREAEKVSDLEYVCHCRCCHRLLEYMQMSVMLFKLSIHKSTKLELGIQNDVFTIEVVDTKHLSFTSLFLQTSAVGYCSSSPNIASPQSCHVRTKVQWVNGAARAVPHQPLAGNSSISGYHQRSVPTFVKIQTFIS